MVAVPRPETVRTNSSASRGVTTVVREGRLTDHLPGDWPLLGEDLAWVGGGTPLSAAMLNLRCDSYLGGICRLCLLPCPPKSINRER